MYVPPDTQDVAT